MTYLGTGREPSFAIAAAPAAPVIAASASPDTATLTKPGWLKEAFGGHLSGTGVRVTAEVALRTSAVFACIQLRAGTLASCPLQLYRRGGEDGDRQLARTHPLYAILHHRPNAWQSAMDFVQMLQAHVDLRGNGFAYIQRDGRGRVLALIPMHPERTVVRRSVDGAFFYDWYPKVGKPVLGISRESILHLRALSLDGEMGLSRIGCARETVGRQIAAEDYGATFFKNDARPGFALSTPNVLGGEVIDRLKKTIGDTFSAGNRFKVAVFEQDLKPHAIGMSNEDAQFLELLNAGVADIARFYDVPPMMIGHDGKSASYASAEVMLEVFKTLTMVEIARMWEQAIQRDVLLDDEAEEFFPEFNLDGIARGSLQARGDFYNKAVGGPWMKPNEARRNENMPAMPDGDKLLKPLNMGGEKPQPEKT